MKKLIKLLCMTLLLTTIFGITKEADAKAAKPKELKIIKLYETVSNAWRNGLEEVGESGEAGWYHVADSDDKFKPTCKKNKDGSYTLTVYDGTYVTLHTNLRWGKDVNKWILKSDKDVLADYNAGDLTYYINANKIRGKAGKTVTKTTYVQPTVVNDNGKTTKKGKKVKIKVVIKHDPKVISELKKIVKNEIKYDKKKFSDFDKAFAGYTWVYKNIKDNGDNITLSETLKKHKGRTKELFVLMCDLMGLQTDINYYESECWANNVFVKVDGIWYDGYNPYDTHPIKNGVNYDGFLGDISNSTYNEFKKYSNKTLQGTRAKDSHPISMRLIWEYERLTNTLAIQKSDPNDWSYLNKSFFYELEEDDSYYKKEYCWDWDWYNSLPEYKTEWTGKEYVIGKGENCF